MRALLDVNVLLALFDANHIHHQLARDWLVAHADEGWASTPITENGFVTLADPQNLIMPQNVIPLASTRVTDARVKVTLDAVSAKLTTEDLLALNGENQGANKTSPKAAASAWLKAEGLV